MSEDNTWDSMMWRCYEYKLPDGTRISVNVPAPGIRPSVIVEGKEQALFILQYDALVGG